MGSYENDNDELLTAIYNYNDPANTEDEDFFKGRSFGDIEQDDLETVLQFVINDKIEIDDEIDITDHNNAGNDDDGDDEIDSKVNDSIIIDSAEQFYVNYESDEDDRTEIDHAALLLTLGMLFINVIIKSTATCVPMSY